MIVSAPQIIQVSLFVIHIAPITERVQGAQGICHAAGFANRLAPGIVLVFYHLGADAVNNAAVAEGGLRQGAGGVVGEQKRPPGKTAKWPDIYQLLGIAM